VDTIYFLALGCFCGVLSSIPIGPTNLWVARAVFPPEKPLPNVALFCSGIIITDAICAFIAFFGYHVYFEETQLSITLAVIVAIAVLVLGFLELQQTLKRDEGSEKKPDRPGTTVRDFGIGLLLGSNPAFIFFWLLVAETLNEWGFPDLVSWPAPLFLVGIGIGDIIWYSVFFRLVKKGLSYFSRKFILTLRLSTAVGLIGFGAYALWGVLS